MPLKINARTLGPGVFCLRVAGELDVATVGILRGAVDRLLEQGCRGLLLDMAGVTFLDSSGIGLLLRILRDMKVRQGDFVITGLTPDLWDLFRITGTRRMFDFVEDPREAEERVRAGETGSNGR